MVNKTEIKVNADFLWEHFTFLMKDLYLRTTRRRMTMKTSSDLEMLP